MLSTHIPKSQLAPQSHLLKGSVEFHYPAGYSCGLVAMIEPRLDDDIVVNSLWNFESELEAHEGKGCAARIIKLSYSYGWCTGIQVLDESVHRIW